MEVVIILASIEKGFSADDSKSQKLFEDAVALLEKQKASLAIEKLLTITTTFPDLYELNYNLGIGFLLIANFESSLAYFNKASEVKFVPLPYLTLMETTHKYKKYAILQKIFDKLETINITDIETLKLIGNSCIKIERWPEALGYYRKAQEVNNSDQDSLYNIALIQYKLNNIDLALDTYLKIENMNPQNYLALNNIASIYELKENFEMAIKYYQKSLQVCPGYSNAYENLISLKNRLNLN